VIQSDNKEKFRANTENDIDSMEMQQFLKK